MVIHKQEPLSFMPVLAVWGKTMESFGTANIRNAKRSDVAVLASLAAELGYATTFSEIENRVERIVSDPHHSVFVAEDRTPIGGIHTCPTNSLEGGTFAENLGLVVTQSHRGSVITAQPIARAEN